MSPQRLIEHVTTEAQGRGDVRTELMTEQLSTIYIYIYPICYWNISCDWWQRPRVVIVMKELGSILLMTLSYSSCVPGPFYQVNILYSLPTSVNSLSCSKST